MKDIKTEKSQEMQEVKKEMSQLKAGEFDSLLSSGGAAYAEAREKEQQQQAPAPKPMPALTKVAQNLGENAKPQSLGLEDLKNAQAQIQQMINQMEIRNIPAVTITKKWKKKSFDWEEEKWYNFERWRSRIEIKYVTLTIITI